MNELTFPQLLLFATIVANAIIAWIVIRNNPRSETNLALSGFSISIALWAVPNYLYAVSTEYPDILFWMRSVFFVTGFMLGFLAYFSLVFPAKTWKVSRFKKALVLLPGIAVGLSSYTDLIVTGADLRTTGNVPVFGIGMIFYFFYVFIYITITLISLRRKFRTANDYLLRRQIIIISAALAILTIPASFTNLVMVFLLGDTSLTALGPAFSLITFSLISYTIIRHRFLDIRLLIGRVIYFLLAGGFLYVGFFGIAWIYEQFFGTIFHPLVYFISGFVAIVFVIAFNDFNKFIRTQVSLKFINPGFDPLETAERFSIEVSTLLDLNSIYEKLRETLNKSIKADHYGLILFGDEQTSTIFSENQRELENHLNSLQSAFSTLWENSDPFTFVVDYMDEVVVSTQFKNISNIVRSAKEQLVQVGIKVALPIDSKDGINGIILIGKKEADLPYSSQEIDFLSSISTTANVAIERSLLYTEVQEFANTLQGKVEERTRELQEVNENLQSTLHQLQEVRRRERDMIDVMGHELRTPMSIVRNALSLLEREYEKTDGNIPKDKLLKYLDMGVESSKREVTLIETLLSATKVDASRLQLYLVKVDFKDVVGDGLEGQKAYIAEKGLEFKYSPPEHDIFVYCDRTRIQQIMDNFLSNAAKYTPQGHIEVRLWNDNDFGWVSISDSGIGIDEEDLHNLGKKFFRAKQYIPSENGEGEKIVRPGGTGLGLYVTFELVRLMGGTLYINSKVGQGTTFTWSMPLFKGQEDKQTDQTFDTSDKKIERSHIVINGNAPTPPA